MSKIFNYIRTVLTVSSVIMVGTYLFSGYVQTAVNLVFSHILGIVLVGLIEVITIRIKEEVEDDN